VGLAIGIGTVIVFGQGARDRKFRPPRRRPPAAPSDLTEEI
jgi:hypothetical protein